MWATMTKDKISMANFDGDDGDDDDYVNDGDDDERQDIDGWVRCQLAQSPYSLAGGQHLPFRNHYHHRHYYDITHKWLLLRSSSKTRF